MKIILKTERLNLREISLSDAPFIFELLNSDDWLKYIGDRDIKTLEDAEKYISNSYIKSYRESGFGFYLMEKREDGTPIGMCGLVKRPQLEDVDIGFAMLSQFGKNGYALEAASATMVYANTMLQIKRVVAITTLENINSQRLLQKVGLRFEKLVDFSGEELMLFGRNFKKTET